MGALFNNMKGNIMGKRSNFKRKASDLYKTPLAGVIPLLPHIEDVKRFAEPCAGDGQLSDHLGRFDKRAMFLGDLQPGRGDITQHNALEYQVQQRRKRNITHIITNPPWDRKLLHPMIKQLATQLPTWLLFDADWPHTLQAQEFMPYLHKVVSVGRLKWIPGSKMSGKDNCAWYLFDYRYQKTTEFYGRVKL